MIASATLDLTGQVAIVTGGASGIGRAIALTLATAGATVAVVDRSTGDTVAAIEANGGRAVAKTVDVTDQHAVEHMVQEVEKQFGDITLLVNNAAIAIESMGLTWEVDPDWWWRTLDVNLRGQFLCARSVLPGMVRRHQGQIMNMSSGTAYSNIAGLSAYSASKSAVARFTGCLAAETRDYGVAVFAINPGNLVRTPLTEAVVASERGQKVSQDFAAAFANGNIEPPEATGRLVVHLASGKADALSGRFVDAGDDIDELIRRADEIIRDDLYTLTIPKLKLAFTP